MTAVDTDRDQLLDAALALPEDERFDFYMRVFQSLELPGTIFDPAVIAAMEAEEAANPEDEADWMTVDEFQAMLRVEMGWQ